MLRSKFKKIVLSLVLGLLCFSVLPTPSHAQDQGKGLLLAAPLLDGSTRQISRVDADVFLSLQKLIQYLNASAGAQYLYANPQMGTPNEIGV